VSAKVFGTLLIVQVIKSRASALLEGLYRVHSAKLRSSNKTIYRKSEWSAPLAYGPRKTCVTQSRVLIGLKASIYF
jgi:hypothetical protein